VTHLAVKVGLDPLECASGLLAHRLCDVVAREPRLAVQRPELGQRCGVDGIRTEHGGHQLFGRP
jgi:hypothetical protein